ncbi:MAG: hypothetical protein ACXVB0_17855, partial [Mucilaginibacter sp.]
MKSYKLKAIVCTIFIANCCFEFSNAQDALKIPGPKIKEEVIYVNVDGNNLSYFTQHPDARRTIGSPTTFTIKGNHVNLYFNWLNPLRYKFTWRDSTYVDDRDATIKDFLTLLAGQFGLPIAAVDKAKGDASKGALLAIHQNPPGLTDTALYIPTNGFDDRGLTDLYIKLRLSSDQLSNAEKASINKTTRKIEEVRNKIAQDIPGKIGKSFENLYKQDTADVMKSLLNAERGNIVGYQTTLKEINALAESIGKVDVPVPDVLLENSIQLAYAEYSEKVLTNAKTQKGLVDKLGSVLNIIASSFNRESSGAGGQPGYFFANEVQFEDGKIMQKNVAVTVYELNKESLEFEKKQNLLESKMIFKKYDLIEFSVSTGIFYSSTEFKTFGVKPSQNTDLIVTEDTIKRNSAVTALFGNFNFGLGSRYLAPVLQIGIDPTKKRPFMLLGGGFSVPAFNFAITGGGVWSWEQTLDKLSVGSPIQSSSELDKDVKYNFKVDPKGWY